MKVYNIEINGKNYEVVKDNDGFFIKPDFIIEGGSGLKPANEPIVLARKPISEKTIAENVLKYETGGINIDGCRVGYIDENDKSSAIPQGRITTKSSKNGIGKAVGGTNDYEIKKEDYIQPEGRFPANVILECICDEVIKGENDGLKKLNFENYGNGEYGKKDGRKTQPTAKEIEGTWYKDKGDIHTNPNCPCRIMDEQSGILKSGNIKPHTQKNKTWKFSCNEVTSSFIGDTGGSSRFFYQAKVSKKERNMGLDGFIDKESVMPGLNTFDENGNRLRIDGSIIPPLVSKNHHPTLKPVQLMAYLCRMVTPKNGIVMDPFMGSGSTGIAAQLEGFQFIGMEMDEEYFNIATTRIDSYEQYKEFVKK